MCLNKEYNGNYNFNFLKLKYYNFNFNKYFSLLLSLTFRCKPLEFWFIIET